MAIKNKSRYALLGVLSMKSSSGYDIKKFCDKTISHFWNENFGHIYPVLSELQKDGLISQEGQDGGVRRKVYGITDKGRKEFLEWLVQPIEYQPARSELLLKLSFGLQIPKEKLIEMLEEVKERNLEKAQQYKLLEQSYSRDEKARKHSQYIYWLAPLRYGIISSEAAVSWCNETIESLKNQEGEA
jgi:PadR family transcriptional regulator AphA